jgi:hypothetical protein
LGKFLAGWDASDLPPCFCISGAVSLAAERVTASSETGVSLDQPVRLPVPGAEIVWDPTDSCTNRSQS